MEKYREIKSKPLPRWVTVLLGMLLAPFTLICVLGSAILLVAPYVPPSLITVSIGSIFLGGSLWVFYFSLRLLFVNPKTKSKFISLVGLKVVALVFTVIPVVSIMLGTFWEKPIIHSIMTIAYVGIVFRLWGMAGQRSKNVRE